MNEAMMELMCDCVLAR